MVNKGGGNKCSKQGIYKDNALNQRLGRVGKKYGTAVYSLVKTTNTSSCKETGKYTDSKRNRKIGRVNYPYNNGETQVYVKNNYKIKENDKPKTVGDKYDYLFVVDQK